MTTVISYLFHVPKIIFLFREKVVFLQEKLEMGII